MRFVHLVEERVGPLFAGAGRGELVAVAIMAGVAEEALFRGVIQETLAARLPVGLAIAGAATTFGVLHWVTTTYAVLATLVGLYLGLLFHLTGNLLAPIAAHALYDVVALLVLARMKPPPPGIVWETGA